MTNRAENVGDEGGELNKQSKRDEIINKMYTKKEWSIVNSSVNMTNDLMGSLTTPTEYEHLISRIKKRMNASLELKRSNKYFQVLDIEKTFGNIFTDFNIQVTVDLEIIKELERFKYIAKNYLETISRLQDDQNEGLVSEEMHEEEIRCLEEELKIQTKQVHAEVVKYVRTHAYFDGDKPLLLHYQKKTYWTPEQLHRYLLEKVSLFLNRLLDKNYFRF